MGAVARSESLARASLAERAAPSRRSPVFARIELFRTGTGPSNSALPDEKATRRCVGQFWTKNDPEDETNETRKKAAHMLRTRHSMALSPIWGCQAPEGRRTPADC